ncbi:MAG: hypothetical protein KatS3mg031_1954 [Chitinophagales bacterium]|nr:MAG: hypothetical protein KatS3mg031_1954 [Chitinophagales bacterium]
MAKLSAWVLLICLAPSCKDTEMAEVALLSPPDGAKVLFEDLLFGWSSSETNCQHAIYVSSDISFIHIHDTIICSGNSCAATDFNRYAWNTTYYWKIASVCGEGTSFSDVFSFFLIDTRDSIIGNYSARCKGEWKWWDDWGVPHSGSYDTNSVPVSISKDPLSHGLIIDCGCLNTPYPLADDIFPLIADSGSLLYGRYSDLLCRYDRSENAIFLTASFWGDQYHHSWDSVFIFK